MSLAAVFDFVNTYEVAKEKSESENKLLVIFWGTEWCPPCNSLKWEFQQLGKIQNNFSNIVSLYLDGDCENAQKVAEERFLSNYPTLLVLSKDTELFRIRTDLNSVELNNALSCINKIDKPIKDILGVSEDTTLSEDEWNLLKYVDFDFLKDFIGAATILTIFRKLYDQAPSQLVELKTRFSVIILETVLKEYSNYPKEYLDKLNPFIRKFLDALFVSKSTILSARDFFIDQDLSIKKITDDLYSGEEKITFLKRMDDAFNLLASIENPSPRFNARLIHRNFSNCKNLDSNKEKYLNDLEALLNKLQNSTELNSCLSSILRTFKALDSIDRYRELILDQTKNGNIPWFYKDILADHEFEAKNFEEALDWQKKAKESAIGSSTIIQWHYQVIQRYYDINRIKYKNEIIQSSQEFAFFVEKQPDGYYGRNKGRCGLLINALQSLKNTDEISEDDANALKGTIGTLEAGINREMVN